MIEGPQAGGGEWREASREEQKGEEHDTGIEGDRTRKKVERKEEIYKGYLLALSLFLSLSTPCNGEEGEREPMGGGCDSGITRRARSAGTGTTGGKLVTPAGNDTREGDTVPL